MRNKPTPEEALYELCRYSSPYVRHDYKPEYLRDIVEKELNENKELKQNLDKLAEDFNYMSKNYQELQDKKKQYKQCYIIKKDRAIKKAQKNEKILNILKDKQPNLFILLNSKRLSSYNDTVKTRKLTKEEFKLIKEWMEK